ncbi:MAG TPA: STAS domain-containing protein [Spirochaetota bacterium]
MDFGRSDQNVYTIEIEGDLDVSHLERLMSVKAMISNRLGELSNCHHIIDLKNVQNIDSAGIGVLVYLKAEIDRMGGTIELVNLNERVSGFFAATAMDEFFNMI